MSFLFGGMVNNLNWLVLDCGHNTSLPLGYHFGSSRQTIRLKPGMWCLSCPQGCKTSQWIGIMASLSMVRRDRFRMQLGRSVASWPWSISSQWAGRSLYCGWGMRGGQSSRTLWMTMGLLGLVLRHSHWLHRCLLILSLSRITSEGVPPRTYPQTLFHPVLLRNMWGMFEGFVGIPLQISA